MDIRIAFAEDEGLEVLQADGDESGYGVEETYYQTYVLDGRRYKTITVVMAETDARVEDEDEDTDSYDMSEYDQGYQDGKTDANFWREYKDGENQQASMDNSGGLFVHESRFPGARGEGAPYPSVDLFNR